MAGLKVAITGASGFVGRHVVRALQKAGHQPIAVLRHPEAAAGAFSHDVEIRRADITDQIALCRSLEGSDAAIHLAGLVSVNRRDRERLYRVNVAGAENFLAAAARNAVGRVIFTSTTSAVGALCDAGPGQPLTETAFFNLGVEPVAYIQSKRRAHERALAAREAGAPVVVLSPSFILGPGDINGNTSVLVDAVRRRRLPVCPGGGVNCIDVRDLARAYVAALEHPDPADHYILASPENQTLKQFVGHVARLSGVLPPRLSLPQAVTEGIAHMVEAIYPNGELTVAGARLGRYFWYFDAARARRELSLTCRPLEETLAATLSWLTARENLTNQQNKRESK